MSDSDILLSAIASLDSLNSLQTTESSGSQVSGVANALSSICLECISPQKSLSQITIPEAKERLQVLADAISHSPSLESIDANTITTLINQLPELIQNSSNFQELSVNIQAHIIPFFQNQTDAFKPINMNDFDTSDYL